MSRGGRGGARSGARAGGPDIHTFELDGDLDELTAYSHLTGIADDDDLLVTLYPPMNPPRCPSPTAKEREEVKDWRELREARRNGPFYIDAPTTGKRNPAEFNAFEDVATYSNKRIKRSRGIPDLKKAPIIKEYLPTELWDVVSDGEEDGETNDAPKKDLNFLKKKRIDKLAQFDEGADGDIAADADEEDLNEEEGEDGVDMPQDDDFSETDNDEGDDYNAEKYFDNDEGPDEDDAGGDGDEAWQLEKWEDSSQLEREAASKSEYRARAHRLAMDNSENLSEFARSAAAADTLERRWRELRGEPKEKIEYHMKRSARDGYMRRVKFQGY